ncbi:MAG TPA: beta-L-arabinofuranosidase domain-containing protein [Acidobacteriaceae bacterium]|nr:beta-L-arabinofuranosidase domain-containing protein [Acidobacteriaceae bacterium]
MNARFTRRRFLHGSAAVFGSGLLLPGGALSRAALASRKAGSASDEVLREFPYSAVTLTDGPLKQQYDQVHASFLALDNDRLLKVYRQRAGLPAPGRDMGGWYDADGFVPGHSLGQYISGLARIGASTGDPACQTKVRELVEGFRATLGPQNESIIRPQSNLWICYILDKHFAGLIDACTLAHVEEARELLPRVLDGSRSLMPVHGHDRIGKKNPPYDETYVMPENLFTAYELTGRSEFHELALDYMLDRDFFDPLARNENVLPGRHAYSHAIALSSAAKAYLVTGEKRYQSAIANGWTYLTTQQQFASGGWGPNEQFVEPHRGELYQSLTTTPDHFETPCGAYAASKLDRYLLRFTGNPLYGDHLERVLYNTVLGLKPPDSDGDYPYYSTYGPDAIKVWYPHKWPCCSGTLVQGVADYVLGIYFRSADGITVNLYVPSELRTELNGSMVKLTQSTGYPADETVSIRVQSITPEAWTLRLRIPAWLENPARIAVNGQLSEVAASPGNFAAIHRRWKSGDVIEARLPQPFHVEPIDDLHRDTVAVLRGPRVLVAINPPGDFEKNPIAMDRGFHPLAQRSDAWLRTERGQQIVFLPLHQVQNERYTTYFTRG